MNFENSIAHKAHGLVHGERAKTYGHPRFDFTAIGKVWTGLLQDLLKEDAVIDPYRVAVLMTGLKLCRLVKSPAHTDSRIDTIGYMLTMERLDEPEEDTDWVERKGFPPGTFAARPCGDECPEPPGTPCCETDSQNCDCLAGACTCRKISFDVTGQPADALKFTQINLWFEPGETKYVNGKGIVNTDKDCGKIICVPLDGNNGPITISPHPPAKCDEHNAAHDCTVKEVHESVHDQLIRPVEGSMKVTANLRQAFIDAAEKHFEAKAVKQVHDHEQQAPCVPPCPVWMSERPAFGFTGEQVNMERPDTRPGGGL